MPLDANARKAEQAVRDAARRRRQAEAHAANLAKHALLDEAREQRRKEKAGREQGEKSALRAASARQVLRLAAMLALAATIVLALAKIRRQLFPAHDMEATGFVRIEDFRRAEAFLGRAMAGTLHAKRAFAADLPPERLLALGEGLARLHKGTLLGVTVGDCEGDAAVTTLVATAEANGVRFVIRLIPRQGQFLITDIAEASP